MNFLTGLAKSLFDSVVGGIVKGINEARKDAKLEELGAANAETRRLQMRIKIMNMAREIDARPTPDSVSGVLARL